MSKRKCSIVDELEIVAADISAYNWLSDYHYREHRLGPFEKIFAIKSRYPRRPGYFSDYLGVIVYGMPPINSQLRNIATDGKYCTGGDMSARLKKVNRDFRCISRVIIEPRVRGLGLASWLVRQTLPQIDVKYVESFATMGEVNPFFEKAGMKKFTAPLSKRCVQIAAALSAVGIEGDMLLDADTVYQQMQKLDSQARAFVNYQMNKFLACYKLGVEAENNELVRIKYVLARMSSRPVYYISEVNS